MNSIFEKVVSIFAPQTCFGCGIEGSLLCEECSSSLVRHPEICYRCHGLSIGYKTCRNCRRYSPLRSVFIATRYEGPLELAIRALKFERASAASVPLARLISDSLMDRQFELVCAVPSASRRQLQRGYNPAELIAKAVAQNMNLPYGRVLGRLGQHRQVGSSRRKRLGQLKGAFYPRNPRFIAGKRILLIDDVVTTGATLAECAKVLKSAGAKSIDAAVVARHTS